VTSGRRRGRGAPLRWNSSLAIAGLGLAIAGGCLQLSGSSDDATPEQVATPEAEWPSAPGGLPVPLVAPSRSRASAAPAVPNAPASKRPVARPGVPLLVAIERLGVSAPVVPIRAEHGSLTPPGNPRKVGWWSGGALPGARQGSAVITGHTVHNGGGAFDELERLRGGDVVVVSTSRGTVRYRVTGVTTYRKQAFARRAATVLDQGSPGRLVLITCEDWTGKVYLSNVVVVAQPMA